ncbi:MAG: sigma-70 family RNA polymerase sigma factor [Sciscionella sp.]|nr:sigma-70 family RNA polymerase sigma factor [Sciscionella sp.]
MRLLALYDSALPQVYGYLLARCGNRAVAEDLTAETFLAAVDSARASGAPKPSVRWLIGVARHKLVDHWRRAQSEAAKVETLAAQPIAHDDPWERRLDVLRAREVLAGLAAHHRAVLTLRYLDGLPVSEVAEVLDRSVHAVEALLTRAKAAFRKAYDNAYDKEGD